MERLTPKDIRDQEFKQSPLGYNKDQVNQFLGEIADELETLIQESNTLHGENKEMRLALATYKNVEEKLKETLLLAQQTARETVKNAHTESETIIRKANIDKEALLFKANEEFTRIEREVHRLQAQRDLILIKLKRHLQANLESLEEQFPEEDESDSFSGQVGSQNERIVDFSKNDLTVEDLSQRDNESEMDGGDAEDFSRE